MSTLIDRLADLLRTGTSLSRFAPEPYSTAGRAFGSIIDAMQGNGRVEVDISDNYAGLIERQMAVQGAMQQFSMESNVRRSEHETRMAPIRNMRLS